jgi:glycosyltransferase involved in cell wall biosynthesis
VKVLQLVTLVSPDGAFGGPVRVAENQARELRARGHDVVVAAGSRGFGPGEAPTELGGAPLHLFPVRPAVPGTGFSGLISPALLRWVGERIRLGVDVVHVHLARDLVTLPAAALARRRGVRYVVQTHGMVVATGNPLAPVLDAALTRRVLADAKAVLYLTPEERAGLTVVGRKPLALQHLGNGVPVADAVPPLPTRPELLFCARLQDRKRPLMFVELAKALLAEGLDASFVLVGPDEGLGPAVQAEVDAFGDTDRLRWEGPLPPSRTLERMGQASALVLPSVDEPYPMSVLEAMSVGRPVVITTSCGLAPAVQETGAGVVVDETFEGLLAGVRRLLATLPESAAAAHEAALTRFAMSAVTDTLLEAYGAR